MEVKDVDLPVEMKRAMARQAEAERERLAKVINAQGELQASQTLADAARVLASEPTALQLRYLQTVTEIAAENNSPPSSQSRSSCSGRSFPNSPGVTPFQRRRVAHEQRPRSRPLTCAAILAKIKVEEPAK